MAFRAQDALVDTDDATPVPELVNASGRRQSRQNGRRSVFGRSGRLSVFGHRNVPAQPMLEDVDDATPVPELVNASGRRQSRQNGRGSVFGRSGRLSVFGHRHVPAQPTLEDMDDAKPAALPDALNASGRRQSRQTGRGSVFGRFAQVSPRRRLSEKEDPAALTEEEEAAARAEAMRRWTHERGHMHQYRPQKMGLSSSRHPTYKGGKGDLTDRITSFATSAQKMEQRKSSNANSETVARVIKSGMLTSDAAAFADLELEHYEEMSLKVRPHHSIIWTLRSSHTRAHE